jgi:hypothetical protein
VINIVTCLLVIKELGKHVSAVTLSATVSRDTESTHIHGNAPVITISFLWGWSMTHLGPGLRENNRMSLPDRTQKESDRSGAQKKVIQAPASAVTEAVVSICNLGLADDPPRPWA